MSIKRMHQTIGLDRVKLALVLAALRNNRDLRKSDPADPLAAALRAAEAELIEELEWRATQWVA